MRKLATTILAVALFGLGQAWAQEQAAGGASAGAGQAEGAALALTQGTVFAVFAGSALVVSASGRSSSTTQH